jgi:hypothetical protein
MEQFVRSGPARSLQECVKIFDLVDVERKIRKLAHLAGEILGLGLALMRPEAIVPEAKRDRVGRPREQGVCSELIA